MEIHINHKSNDIKENVAAIKDLIELLQSATLLDMQGELTMKVNIEVKSSKSKQV